MITDLFSRKIIGYDVRDTLAIEGSLAALGMALSTCDSPVGLIHHSDRGVQYCAQHYTDLLHQRDIRISMGEKGNPYDNAVAERVHGILKLEFLLDQLFGTFQRRSKVVDSLPGYTLGIAGIRHNPAP